MTDKKHKQKDEKRAEKARRENIPHYIADERHVIGDGALIEYTIKPAAGGFIPDLTPYRNGHVAEPDVTDETSTNDSNT